MLPSVAWLSELASQEMAAEYSSSDEDDSVDVELLTCDLGSVLVTDPGRGACSVNDRRFAATVMLNANPTYGCKLDPGDMGGTGGRTGGPGGNGGRDGGGLCGGGGKYGD
eukprot:6639096-Prymnesium_polylepis.1